MGAFDSSNSRGRGQNRSALHDACPPKRKTGERATNGRTNFICFLLVPAFGQPALDVVLGSRVVDTPGVRHRSGQGVGVPTWDYGNLYLT